MGIKATQRRTEVPQLTSTAKIPDSERGLCTKGGGGMGHGWRWPSWEGVGYLALTLFRIASMQ